MHYCCNAIRFDRSRRFAPSDSTRRPTLRGLDLAEEFRCETG